MLKAQTDFLLERLQKAVCPLSSFAMAMFIQPFFVIKKPFFYCLQKSVQFKSAENIVTFNNNTKLAKV